MISKGAWRLVCEQTEAALPAVFAAGAEILEVYGKADFATTRKEDASPLTEADRRAHEAIVRQLGKTGTAALPILSEEGADIPFEERRRWSRYRLVDPLDGTKEFIKRNGEFTVNIALMKQASGKGNDAGAYPLSGLVYIPVNDVLYAGVLGEGAWRVERARTQGIEKLKDIREKGQQLPLRSVRSPEGSSRNAAALRVVVSRSHNNPPTEAFIEAVAELRGPAERVSSGSSIKLCMVAEGSADLYPRFGPTMEWDTAAADAVCRAAGCAVLSLPQDEKPDDIARRIEAVRPAGSRLPDGADSFRPLRYNKKDLHNPYFLVMR